MFLSLHLPMTENQIPNFYFCCCRSGKRRGLLSFQIVTTTTTTIVFGFQSPADATKEKLLLQKRKENEKNSKPFTDRYEHRKIGIHDSTFHH